MAPILMQMGMPLAVAGAVVTSASVLRHARPAGQHPRHGHGEEASTSPTSASRPSSPS